MYTRANSVFPIVDHYWWMKVEAEGNYPQAATSEWALVFVKHREKTEVRLLGPRTLPTKLPYFAGEAYWSVVFVNWVGISGLPKSALLNNNLHCPVKAQSFNLADHTVPIPAQDGLDLFVGYLIEKSILLVEHDLAPKRTQPNKENLTDSHRITPSLLWNPRTLQRRFKQKVGMSQKQSQRAQRMKTTIELLADTNLALAEVAATAGFSDQAHMTRECNSLVGLSPSHLRSYFQS